MIFVFAFILDGGQLLLLWPALPCEYMAAYSFQVDEYTFRGFNSVISGFAFILGRSQLYADQMFQATTEVYGEGSDTAKHVKAPE